MHPQWVPVNPRAAPSSISIVSASITETAYQHVNTVLPALWSLQSGRARICVDSRAASCGPRHTAIYCESFSKIRHGKYIYKGATTVVRMHFSALSSCHCLQRVNFQPTTAGLMQAHQSLTSTTTWKETEAWSVGLLFLSLSSARRPSLTGEVGRVLLGDSARPSAESCTTAAARTLAQTVVTSCISGAQPTDQYLPHALGS